MLKRISWCLSIIAVCVGASACAGSNPATGSSGVDGTVTLAPTCPGPQLAGRNCASTLSARLIELIDTSGAVIASTSTKEDGSFTLPAAPGNYQLRVVRQGLFPRCPVVPVVIVAGAVARTDVACDTGMR